MKYNELNTESQKNPKRAGRGISAGRGKTAGRGTKGQGARKSGNVRAGFEGGQNPLYMRLPKLRGFKSRSPKPEVIYTGQLDQLKKTVVDAQVLYEAGLVKSPYSKIKLINNGEVTKKIELRLPAASKSAAEVLKKAGGSFIKTERLAATSIKAKSA